MLASRTYWMWLTVVSDLLRTLVGFCFQILFQNMILNSLAKHYCFCFRNFLSLFFLFALKKLISATLWWSLFLPSSLDTFCEANCCRGKCHQLTLQRILVFLTWADVAVIPLVTSSCFPTTYIFRAGALAVIFAQRGMNNIYFRFRCKEKTLWTWLCYACYFCG